MSKVNRRGWLQEGEAVGARGVSEMAALYCSPVGASDRYTRRMTGMFRRQLGNVPSWSLGCRDQAAGRKYV